MDNIPKFAGTGGIVSGNGLIAIPSGSETIIPLESTLGKRITELCGEVMQFTDESNAIHQQINEFNSDMQSKQWRLIKQR